ncbi:MAG: ADP-ribosyltransferase, partial [Myxococcaceae bacterium]
AQAAGTVAAVAATVATAGAGAPLLVTAAAGAGASVAARSAMEGRAYAKDDAARDAASGVISSLAGTAGAAVVGKAATSLVGQVAKEAASGAVSGFIQGSADTALRDETWNAGLVEGLASTGLAGGKSALQSAAMSGAKVVAGQVNPLRQNVVATKFPGEKAPVDLSTIKSDAATKSAAKAMLKEQGTFEVHESMVKFTKKNTPSLAKVNTDDLISLREYTANGYVKMNEGLRGSKMALKATAPIVKTAASGLKAMPEVKGTVYRGANMTPERLAGYKVGETISERGFTSTTLNKAMVLGKGPEQSFNKNTMFVIKSKGGGKDVSMLSQYPDEKEVLFAPGTEFKVLKNSFDNRLSKNVIYLQEVP